MNRRALLTGTGVTLSSMFAGCLVDGSSSVDNIAVSEPTVSKGETANIAVEAPNLSGLHISDFPKEFTDGSLRLGEATFTPSPELVWQAYPPHWQFDEQDTEGIVPMETFSETPTDTYEFGFDFYIAGESEPRHVGTTVTVESNSKS